MQYLNFFTLQEKPSDIQWEPPTLQNKFLNFFAFLYPDPENQLNLDPAWSETPIMANTFRRLYENLLRDVGD
jgi:hypothetical protein